MTLDAIIDIRRAEEEAVQIVRNSLSDARTALADANTQAALILEEASSEGRITAEESILLAEKRADAGIDKIRAKTAAECEQIEKYARKKFAEATAIIAGRIIKSNVDR